MISNDSWGSFGESFILRICSGPARDQKFRGKFRENIVRKSCYFCYKDLVNIIIEIYLVRIYSCEFWIKRAKNTETFRKNIFSAENEQLQIDHSPEAMSSFLWFNKEKHSTFSIFMAMSNST